MVRNFGKGGKGHRKMKNDGLQEGTRELLFKMHDQDYGIVVDMCGHGRCRVRSFADNIERLAIIRGSMRHKQITRVGKGDVVLVGLREYQPDKSDIIHVYTPEETRRLVDYEEITTIFVNEDDSDSEEVIFENI